jgi:hypothetical protein
VSHSPVEGGDKLYKKGIMAWKELDDQ